ncbi:HlyD family type I secretion periplasmic adaptor subunit [Aliiroseovarius sp. 2305UL8-7]|uniref:HlyD family type I secretion periplasmic adaptor subunit n=1 Tax=Aliiroseovarius conchicola TaxID=3121637 RepID=UPI003526D290
MSLAAPNTPQSRWRVFAYDRAHAGRGPMFVGLTILIPLLLGFGTWAAIAPLNSAAIAPGEIVLSSDRKTIQHLEGGLVSGIFVQEGDAVTSNDPLLIVQDLIEQSQKEAFTVQLVNTNAQIARLIAERDVLAEPNFSDVTRGLDANPETVERFKSTHLGVFRNLTGSASSARDLASSRKVQIRREIEGLNAQLSAKRREVELVSHELDAKRKLLEQGLVTEAEMNALARNEIALEGEIGALIASIAKSEQSILDQDVEILRMQNERASVMLGELQEAQVAAENIRQELRTLQDRQNRAVIRAPVSGVVLGMQVHTIGAVVSPGVPLMDIVQDEDDLIVQTRVKPTDVDLVSAGMSAQVQLSAFKAKKVDKLDAIVETISGDIITDEASGERYFLARLRVKEEALATLPADVTLSPGMPADVFLIAGERTMADYLLSPIFDAVDRAFKED